MERTLSLFEAVGIEIESMIVDAQTLDVRSIADEVLRECAGADEWTEDFDDGKIAWSNELVTHVIELKTNGPAPSFHDMAGDFRSSAARLATALDAHGARLMPTGMHPWMEPARETRLWPHETGPIYRAYDRLFDCRRHGFANLQSVHVNLPFSGEDEFARLMAAVRIVLPLIPALAASTPIVEGRATGKLDSRLDVYRTNSQRTPSMTGSVIPEPIYTFDAYRERVLMPIDRELEALGADPVLRGGQEWTNARGAIARFDRMAVEIRLIDAQECARADIAIAAAVTALVRDLVEERGTKHDAQRAVPTDELRMLLERTIDRGPATTLDDPAYAALFGSRAAKATTVGELLKRVVERSMRDTPELEQPLALILDEGTLAERIVAATGPDPTRETLRAVYATLCDSLASGESFRP